MKYLALVAAMLASATLAAPLTVQGVGESDSTSFQVNALVGPACSMTSPNDVTIPVMYWFLDTPTKFADSVVNIVCNTGVVFQLGSDISITLQKQGTLSADPGADNTLTATVTGGDAGPETAGSANGASTSGGYNKTIRVTVNQPTQSNPSGTYIGTVNLTLSVIADGDALI